MDKMPFKGLINQLCALTLNKALFKNNKTVWYCVLNYEWQMIAVDLLPSSATYFSVCCV